MKTSRPAVPYEAVQPVPVTFNVGHHVLSISCVVAGQWKVSLDGGPSSRTYATRCEAWEAGVRAADELDRASRVS